MRFESLTAAHDRSSFDCGKEPLNDYLRRYASQSDKRHNTRTFVLCAENSLRVIGYYSTTVKSLEAEAVPESLGGYPLPVVLLARLALDKEFIGQGLGSLLLVDALRRVARAAQHVGIRAVEVNAIDDEARSFYQHFGFQSLQDDPRHLYLPMKVLLKSSLMQQTTEGL